MFSAQTYRDRREALAELIGTGTILLLGYQPAPITHTDHNYPFRQESSFRYFFGLNEPSSAGLIDASTGTSVLYGHDPDLTDIIWEGDTAPLVERATPYGVDGTMPMRSLAADLVLSDNIMFVPSTRASMSQQLQDVVGVDRSQAETGSEQLIDAIVALRSIKTAEEITEIVEATNRTKVAHLIAMASTRPGIGEAEVVRAMRTDAARHGYIEAYGPIFTVKGEVLHNPHHRNTMNGGALALHDGALLSDLGYASDVTRTFPVDGRFSSVQRTVYQTVLDAQTAVIQASTPGVLNADMHTLALTTIFEGLGELGVTRGDTTEAVAEGAAALFMPHGIGHMLGLDVHDMEGIGETSVGYTSDVTRSEQFGRNNLRLGRHLQDGFVITVEPGCYFIPALIDRWEQEGRWNQWINFDRLKDFKDFGGARIEDVVHITASGSEVLGDHIPKTIDEVEAACS